MNGWDKTLFIIAAYSIFFVYVYFDSSNHRKEMKSERQKFNEELKLMRDKYKK